MNLKKELVNTFKNLLNVYFGKVYTKDELKVSDMVVGGTVEIIGPDGTLSPAPDGEYVMDSGESFVVKNGLIESIIGQVEQSNKVVTDQPTEMADPTMEQPIEPAPEAPSPEDIKIQEIDSRLSELENKIAELTSKLEGMSSQSMEIKDAVQNFNQIVGELNSNVKTLANIPVEFSKTDKSVDVQNEKQDKMIELATILSRKK